MEMCSKAELEEMCWLVNIFRETGSIEVGDVTDDKPTTIENVTRNRSCRPMEKMLKRVYMSFLELKPISDVECDDASPSDSEAGVLNSPSKRCRMSRDCTGLGSLVSDAQ